MDDLHLSTHLPLKGIKSALCYLKGRLSGQGFGFAYELRDKVGVTDLSVLSACLDPAALV